MTISLPATLRRAPVEGAGPSPVWLAAATGALTAAASGLGAAVLVVLLAWAAAADSGASAVDAVRTGGLLWLVAHHVPLAVPGGFFGLAPLGLVALACWPVVRSARIATRQCEAATRLDRYLLAGLMTAVYGAVAGLVSVLSATPDVRSVPWLALLAGVVLAAPCTAFGVDREAGLLASRRLAGRIPATWRAVGAGALAGMAVLLGTGALLVGIALALDVPTSVELAEALDPGIVGGLLLALVGVALAPNAAVFGAAVVVGPGFAVGSGTTVTPVLAELGAVPALPILAALPATGPQPGALMLVLAAPVVAGVVTALVILRRCEALAPLVAARTAALGGVVGGALLGVLAALSGGPVGSGRLSTVGPSPWQVGVAAAVELAAVAAATAWITRKRPLSFAFVLE